jgi:hypothetical protein
MVDNDLTWTMSDFVHFEGVGEASSYSSLSSPTPTPSSPLAPAIPPHLNLLHWRPHLRDMASTTWVHDEQHTLEFATSQSNDEDHVGTYHDDEPLPHNGQHPRRVVRLWTGATRLRCGVTLAHDDAKPYSFTEAEGDVVWRTTMQLEMDVVERN